MPLRFGSVGLFFSLVAIAYAGRFANDDMVPQRTRGPASIAAMQKESKLGAFKIADQIRHTEKLHGPLSIHLEMLGAKPEVGDTFVMRGTITSRKPLPEANFQWTVPNGLEVVNGALTGTVNGVSADQPANIEITLRKLTSDNAQVHLMANSVLGNARFGDSTQYNTDVQSLLVKSAKAATLDGAGDSSTQKPMRASEIKIFH
jgi:hypothetical protein